MTGLGHAYPMGAEHEVMERFHDTGPTYSAEQLSVLYGVAQAIEDAQGALTGCGLRDLSRAGDSFEKAVSEALEAAENERAGSER